MTDFPDDPNGDVLRRMREQGDDLSIARDIEYSVVFGDRTAAVAFAMAAEKLGLRTSIDTWKDGEEGNPVWDVTVSRFMLPDYAEITAFEEELDRLAAPLGGETDGWGSFSQP